MQTGVLMGSNEGQSIPTPVLTKAGQLFPDYVGIAMLGNDGKFAISRGIKPDMAKAIASIEEIQKENVGEKLFVYFGKSPTGYLPDDLQPYVVLQDNKGEPLILAFAEGDYTPFTHDDSTKSREFFFIDELVRPTIDEAFAGDLEALLKKLEGPLTRKNFMNAITGRGECLLLCANGSNPKFTKNAATFGRDYTWGWITNHMNMAAAKEAKPAEEAKPAKGEFGSDFGKRTKPPAAAVPPLDKKIPPPKTDTAVPDDAGTEVVLQPPKHFDWNAAKHFYEKCLGWIPANLNKKDPKSWPGVPISKYREAYKNHKNPPYPLTDDGEVVVKSFSDLPKPADKPVETKPPAPKPAEVPKVDKPQAPPRISDKPAAKPPAETTQAPPRIGGKKPAVVEDRPAAAPPSMEKHAAAADDGPSHEPDKGLEGAADGLISADDKQFTVSWLSDDKVKKVLDKYAKDIMDPKKIQSMEDNIPSLAEAVGPNIGFAALRNWPRKLLGAFMRENPDSVLEQFAVDARNYICELEDMISDGQKTKPGEFGSEFKKRAHNL